MAKFFAQQFLLLISTLSQFHATISFVPESKILSLSRGSTAFHFGDDKAERIELATPFRFLGSVYSTAYINGNGIINFNSPSDAHSYHCTPEAAELPTIAVYMADSDMNDGNAPLTTKLLYKQETTNSSVLQQVSIDVFSAFPSLKNISLNWALVVTWYKVAPLDEDWINYRNTFQAILTTDGSSSFALFYYSSITWPATQMKNSPSQIGFFGGLEEPEKHYLVPGSCTYSLINAAGMSNINSPGKFVFRVNDAIDLPNIPNKCKQGSDKPIKVHITPYVVNALGTQPLMIENVNLICPMEQPVMVTCQFVNDNVIDTTEGVVLTGPVGVFCPKPWFADLGRVLVKVLLTFENETIVEAQGYIIVVSGVDKGIDISVHENETAKGLTLSVNWTLGFTKMEQVQKLYVETLNKYFSSAIPKYVNISIMELSGYAWRKLHTFENVSNSGAVTNLPLPIFVVSTLISTRVSALPRVVVISNTVVLETGEELTADYVSDIYRPTLQFARLKAPNNNEPNIYDRKCKQWWRDQESNVPQNGQHCPPINFQVWTSQYDISYMSNDDWFENHRDFLGVHQLYGSQSEKAYLCAYNENGSLELSSGYGSRVFLWSPNNPKNHWDHYLDDIWPYLECCLLSFNREENCKTYYFGKRAAYPDYSYRYPVPFKVIGLSQITTLSQYSYVLKGNGEYMLLSLDHLFSMSAKFENFSLENSTISSSIMNSILFVIRSGNNITTLEVGLDQSKELLLWLDREPLNFYRNEQGLDSGFVTNATKLYHKQVTVEMHENPAGFTFTFVNGIQVVVMPSPENAFLEAVGLVPLDLASEMRDLLTLTADESASSILENSRVNPSDSLSLFAKLNETLAVNKTKRAVLQTPEYLLELFSKNYSLVDSNETCFGNRECMVTLALTNSTLLAQSTIYMDGMYKDLLRVTKTTVLPRQCKQPEAIANGGISEESIDIGSTFSFYCYGNYRLDVKSKNSSKAINEKLEWKCLPKELMPNNITSKVGLDKVESQTWVSVDYSEVLSDVAVKCVPLEMQDSSTEPSAKIHETSHSSHTTVVILSCAIVVLLIAVSFLSFKFYVQKKWGMHENLLELDDMIS